MRTLGLTDVVLHDVVSTEVLSLISPRTQIINVGKRRGRKSITQDQLNNLLLQFTLVGQVVVRLKSGDPLIFEQRPAGFWSPGRGRLSWLRVSAPCHPGSRHRRSEPFAGLAEPQMQLSSTIAGATVAYKNAESSHALVGNAPSTYLCGRGTPSSSLPCLEDKTGAQSRVSWEGRADGSKVMRLRQQQRIDRYGSRRFE